MVMAELLSLLKIFDKLYHIHICMRESWFCMKKEMILEKTEENRVLKSGSVYSYLTCPELVIQHLHLDADVLKTLLHLL